MNRIVLVLAVLSLAGCASTSSQSNSDPSFNVVNRSSTTIRSIYVSPVDSNSWGRDWLGDTVLNAGRQFRVAPPRDGRCVYDVRVVYSGDQSEERRRQNLCSLNEIAFTGPAQAAAPAASSSNPDFDIVNRSSLTIREIYVASTQASQWGQDRLPGTLAPGARFSVRLPRDGQCQYSVRVVYDNGRSEERRGQNACGITELAFSGPARQRASPAQEAMNQHWVRYLRQIQSDNAYPNWSRPPYDLYESNRQK